MDPPVPDRAVLLVTAAPRRDTAGKERSMHNSRRSPRQLARSLLIAVLLGLLLAGLPAAANAASNRDTQAATQQAAQAAAACEFHVGYTIKQGTVIRGSGSYTRCTVFWRIRVQLQRERWYGWQALSTKWRSTSGSVGVSWNCAGAGTYTYRTIVHAYHRDGRVSGYKISNRLRVAC
jgi:hypothetical protein